MKARYGDRAKLLMTRMNKKVIGMMKDELKEMVVTEFCGNRAKSYSFVVDGGTCKKKCKGIKKSVVKKELTIEDYKDCVLGGKGKTLEQVNFRSYKHEMFTGRVRKVALSPYDDKRVVLNDGVQTLPIGHWRVKHPVLYDQRFEIAPPRKGTLADLANNALP